MIRTFTKKQKADIQARRQALIDDGRIKENLEGLTEEEALDYILPDVNFDEDEARFILAMTHGDIRNELKQDTGIVY